MTKVARPIKGQILNKQTKHNTKNQQKGGEIIELNGFNEYGSPKAELHKDHKNAFKDNSKHDKIF